MKIQYDVYKNTKDILKDVRSEHKDRLQTQLPSQGVILSFVINHSLNVTKGPFPLRSDSDFDANSLFDTCLEYDSGKLSFSFPQLLLSSLCDLLLIEIKYSFDIMQIMTLVEAA